MYSSKLLTKVVEHLYGSALWRSALDEASVRSDLICEPPPGDPELHEFPWIGFPVPAVIAFLGTLVSIILMLKPQLTPFPQLINALCCVSAASTVPLLEVEHRQIYTELLAYVQADFHNDELSKHVRSKLRKCMERIR
jgi:hypothetical protein